MAETTTKTIRGNTRRKSGLLLVLGLAGGVMAGLFFPAGTSMPAAVAQDGKTCSECAAGSSNPDSGQGLLTCATVRRSAHMGCWLGGKGSYMWCSNVGTCTIGVRNPWNPW
jgi:hypothetical protein